MILAGFLFLIFLPGSISEADWNCSYQDVINYLNLTKNKDLYTLSRPVKNYKETTRVHIQMSLYGIVDVRETDQTFVPYIWIYMGWKNEHIWWDPAEFCGLEKVIIPKEYLWMPDLTIEEMTEKEKSPLIPFLTVQWSGKIEFRTEQVLVSTCRMQVFKFPFDIQSCNLSFKSAVYSDEEAKFEAILDSSKITRWSEEIMRNHYEWLFINMTVKETTINNFSYNQSMIVYTFSNFLSTVRAATSLSNLQFTLINMKRRSVLYIVNFILPILFFFCLDLASFLISDRGGEKLSFKVTVLLSVTVMQLMLNDILPSSSDRVPLIVVFCIGMFGMMLLSLLETVLVMYLREKDSEKEADKDQGQSEYYGDKEGKDNMHKSIEEVKKWTDRTCFCDASADEPPSELLSVAKEDPKEEIILNERSSSQLKDHHALEKLSDELRVVERSLLLNCKGKEGELGYWTRVTKTINRVFLTFYITVASVFLVVLFAVWTDPAYE